MQNYVFDSKHCKLCETETPTGSLYYAIYYDYSELSGEAFVNMIELTLPDGSVVTLNPEKYKELYSFEEENLTKQLL